MVLLALGAYIVQADSSETFQTPLDLRKPQAGIATGALDGRVAAERQHGRECMPLVYHAPGCPTLAPAEGNKKHLRIVTVSRRTLAFSVAPSVRRFPTARLTQSGRHSARIATAASVH